MNEFILCILASGICGSLILLVIKMAEHKRQEYFTGIEIYFWMKLSLFAFLFPLIFGGIRLYFMYRIIVTPADGPKFTEWITCRNLEILRKRELFPQGLWQFNFLFVIWAVGIVGRYIFIYSKKRRNLKCVLRDAEQIQDGDAIEIIECLGKEMGIKRHISVYRSSMITSPILFGIRTPRILLPVYRFSREELMLIARHELEHYKHGDLMIKKLLGLIREVHWFNPLVSYCLNILHDYGELACDERVAEQIGKESRIKYIELLIRLKKVESGFCDEVAMSDSAEELMKRRIKTVLKPAKKIKKQFFVGIVLILAAGCVGVSYLSVYVMTEIYDQALEKELPSIAELEVTDQMNIHIEYTEELYLSETENWETLELIPTGEKMNEFRIVIPKGQTKVVMIHNEEDEKALHLVSYSKHIFDEYDGGIVSDTKQYVKANRGIINHVFRVEETNSYQIFFENTSSHSIYLIGYFYSF